MNILKIKTILNFCIAILIVTLTFNSVTAQSNFIDNPYGGHVKSQELSSQLYLKNKDGVNLGALTGIPGTGSNSPSLNLRNHNFETVLTLKDNKIGLGQTDPKLLLHLSKVGGLSSSFNTANNRSYTVLSHNYNWSGGAKRLVTGKVARVMMSHAGDYTFQTAGNGNANSAISFNTKFYIDNVGRVSIGDAASNLPKKADGSLVSANEYRLYVAKGIMTEKIKCSIDKSTDWADYVFEEDYERMPLDELEEFVTENKHLPKVPSAEEMVENGLDVAKMDAKLLEKIEEAYLYIIDMNREMEAMNEKVDALANENQSLKSSLQSISTSGK